MKTKEIRELGNMEVKEKLSQLENELLKARSQATIGSKGTASIRTIRKTMARIKTIIKEREIKK